jgi:hypothetical protein
MTDCYELSTTDKTECWVREYFEMRNWSVEKLDKGTEEAADFEIRKDDVRFLCEIKTVESVHANLPWPPSLDVFEAERKKHRAEYERWARDNPNPRLVLRQSEHEFAYGDHSSFKRKYQGRARHTESEFRKFADDMRCYFACLASVQHLPFIFRLDSDDLYVPDDKERERFYKWLENELLAIAENRHVDRRWDREDLPSDSVTFLSMFYPIHQATRENDIDSYYQLTVTGPWSSDKLDVQLFSYGQLNLDAITRNVESGVSQLEATVLRDAFRGLPQVIALAFAGGLTFEWETLRSHISWLLLQHTSLNAVALLGRAIQGEPPDPRRDGFEAFFSWLTSSAITQPMETRFLVVHNTWHPNEHKETITQAFEYDKNGHVDSHTIEIPQSWLPD